MTILIIFIKNNFLLIMSGFLTRLLIFPSFSWPYRVLFFFLSDAKSSDSGASRVPTLFIANREPSPAKSTGVRRSRVRNQVSKSPVSFVLCFESDDYLHSSVENCRGIGTKLAALSYLSGGDFWILIFKNLSRFPLSKYALISPI